VVHQFIPLLSEALGWVAMPQVRSRGTVIGCLAQANAGGEVPVVSLALDAELEILLSNGASRRMPAKDVYAVETGTKLPPNSLILSASFRSRSGGEGWGFSEVQLRQGHFALVCCAATLLVEETGRIKSASIAVGALTSETADHDSLIREAAHIAAAERPWPARTDLHATGAFRSKAAIAAVGRALTDARARCSYPRGNQ
jgi:carbon-monoxide dehydrogenase medium subunit